VPLEKFFFLYNGVMPERYQLPPASVGHLVSTLFGQKKRVLKANLHSGQHLPLIFFRDPFLS